MRGTQLVLKLVKLCKRITSAYAGNTVCLTFGHCFLQDHPRLRGEHAEPFHTILDTAGSPPPTRGTQALLNGLQASGGITPAYAGNTIYEWCVFFKVRDHPRLRGEHYFILIFTDTLQGSPPPTRGTLKH